MQSADTVPLPVLARSNGDWNQDCIAGATRSRKGRATRRIRVGGGAGRAALPASPVATGYPEDA